MRKAHIVNRGGKPRFNMMINKGGDFIPFWGGCGGLAKHPVEANDMSVVEGWFGTNEWERVKAANDPAFCKRSLSRCAPVECERLLPLVEDLL